MRSNVLGPIPLTRVRSRGREKGRLLMMCCARLWPTPGRVISSLMGDVLRWTQAPEGGGGEEGGVGC